MDIDEFFDFSSNFSASTVRAYAIDLMDILDSSGDILLESDHNKLIMGDYKGISFPVVFKQEKGRKWDDILTTGWVSLYLISDKLKSVLEENKLTGWKTFPIKLLDKKGNEITGYHGFSVVGLCGPIDHTKSEIFQKKLSEGGTLCNFYKGRYIGFDKWDGSDFFHPEGNFGIIVTSRAAEVLRKNKITNLFLENLAEVEIYAGICRSS